MTTIQGLCASMRFWHVGNLRCDLSWTQEKPEKSDVRHWTSLDIAGLFDHILFTCASNSKAERENNHRRGPSNDNWLRMLDASILRVSCFPTGQGMLEA